MDSNVKDWIFRFVKGMFIGSGAILPGVSGGALAAVFGIYERMISFIANITHEFKKNVLFFIPVGLGGVFGVFVLSFPINYFLSNYEVQILWFFIGCIFGTLPSLWREAGKKGRDTKHIIIMLVTFVLGYILLRFGEGAVSGSLPQNIFTWLLAGAIIGLGAIIPGLSPSNFLVYLNMYEPMTNGIKSLDFSVIIPIGIGGVLIVFGLSKIMNYIFERAYAALFHFILGIVFASTVMIIPLNFNYLSPAVIVCIIACALGTALGAFMSKLDEKYKPAD